MLPSMSAAAAISAPAGAHSGIAVPEACERGRDENGTGGVRAGRYQEGADQGVTVTLIAWWSSIGPEDWSEQDDPDVAQGVYVAPGTRVSWPEGAIGELHRR